MTDRMMSTDQYLLVLGICLAAITLNGRRCVAQETSQSMLAAQIREQGYACDKALSAVRDAKRSKPDYEVWVLKCSNATYRIGRFPDIAAKVERLH
jgi:hypothetical protein